jgi:hypothetical protein
MHSNTYTVPFDAFEDDWDDELAELDSSDYGTALWAELDHYESLQDPETVWFEREHEAICELYADLVCENPY